MTNLPLHNYLPDQNFFNCLKMFMKTSETKEFLMNHRNTPTKSLKFHKKFKKPPKTIEFSLKNRLIYSSFSICSKCALKMSQTTEILLKN